MRFEKPQSLAMECDTKYVFFLNWNVYKPTLHNICIFLDFHYCFLVYQSILGQIMCTNKEGTSMTEEVIRLIIIILELELD